MSCSTIWRWKWKGAGAPASITTLYRRDLATDWLAKTARPVSRIGADLGFADAAAFYRAFAGWTGSGPREYRKRFKHSTGLPPHPA